MIYKKTCEWCGASFTAQKSSTRFCSKLCTDHAYKEKVRRRSVEVIQKHDDSKVKVMSDNFMTLGTLAAYLNVSRTTAWRYVNEGLFPSLKARGRIRVRKEDVDAAFRDARPYQKSSKTRKPKGGEKEHILPLPSCLSSLKRALVQHTFAYRRSTAACMRHPRWCASHLHHSDYGRHSRDCDLRPDAAGTATGLPCPCVGCLYNRQCADRNRQRLRRRHPGCQQELRDILNTFPELLRKDEPCHLRQIHA